MRLDILILRSSLPEWIRVRISEALGDFVELPWGYVNKWDYLMMHQLQPCVEKDPQNQKDINRRLDWVMKNDRL
jgi:hypothetical protein